MRFISFTFGSLALFTCIMLAHFFSFDFEERLKDLERFSSLKHVKFHFKSKSHEEFIYGQ